MPTLALSISEEAVHLIWPIPNDWGAQGINNLAPQQQITSTRVAQLHNISHENEKICEPHGWTQIVEYMANAVGQTLTSCQSKSRPEFSHVSTESGTNISSRQNQDTLLIDRYSWLVHVSRSHWRLPSTNILILMTIMSNRSAALHSRLIWSPANLTTSSPRNPAAT